MKTGCTELDISPNNSPADPFCLFDRGSEERDEHYAISEKTVLLSPDHKGEQLTKGELFHVLYTQANAFSRSAVMQSSRRLVNPKISIQRISRLHRRCPRHLRTSTLVYFGSRILPTWNSSKAFEPLLQYTPTGTSPSSAKPERSRHLWPRPSAMNAVSTA